MTRRSNASEKSNARLRKANVLKRCEYQDVLEGVHPYNKYANGMATNAINEPPTLAAPLKEVEITGEAEPAAAEEPVVTVAKVVVSPVAAVVSPVAAVVSPSTVDSAATVPALVTVVVYSVVSPSAPVEVTTLV